MEQYARIELEVGGAAKEKGLVREFLLASIEPSMDRRRVSVGAYVVRGWDLRYEIIYMGRLEGWEWDFGLFGLRVR